MNLVRKYERRDENRICSASRRKDRVSRERLFNYAFLMTPSNSPATVAALVDSLRHDPFYETITKEFADDEARRRHALARYFDYSMSEGARMGRLFVWPDPAVGAAVWLLPAAPSAAVGETAWYLSIVGVTPSAQGQGIGKRLIEPTLADADVAGVDCYLETFDRRNPGFYQRLEFATVASHAEPTTGATHSIMLRKPKAGET
jgi:GNAT superfamily N-acetyltransferase